MKGIVIYSSLSGNTKKIAEAIHAGMSQSGEQCDIARIKDVDTQDLVGYDLIGLGSYVNITEPVEITNFIQHTMKSAEGKHAFAFCTHGALPGYYMASVVPAMIQRGLTAIGWNDWFGSCVYPIIPKPYFTDGHPDEIDLKEAEDFGREMVERSRRIYQGETKLIPTLPRGKAYDDIYITVETPPIGTPLAEWRKFRVAKASIEYKVNPAKCKYPKCTVCIDNCPTGSIDFSVSPPTFNINCQSCYHCEQICPSGAIEVDYMPFKIAQDPFVTSLLQRSLEILEARGRFRRLVPLKDIGWDTPFFKTKKPPRYKIP